MQVFSFTGSHHLQNTRHNDRSISKRLEPIRQSPLVVLQLDDLQTVERGEQIDLDIVDRPTAALSIDHRVVIIPQYSSTRLLMFQACLAAFIR